MALLKKSELRSQVSKASGFLVESNIRNFATTELINGKRADDRKLATYDVFLSHSFEDAIYIKALRDLLVELGFTVYVDWIEDPQMERANVTKQTAAVLRERMHLCKCLLYMTSQAAKKSVWMPWELGFMDARTKARVAIAPIVEDAEANNEFKGQEYLGLYPYLDKTGAALYIHESARSYVGFQRWLAGVDPVLHS